MNRQQKQAATQLLRALNKCYAVGLAGGIYDGEFSVWPQDVDIELVDDQEDFIEEHGRALRSPMTLFGRE